MKSATDNAEELIKSLVAASQPGPSGRDHPRDQRDRRRRRRAERCTLGEGTRMTATTETTTGVGRVARVTGPVVDVEFPVEAMPELYNALHVDVDFGLGRGGRREPHPHPRGGPAHRRQHGARHLDAADRRPRPRCRGARHRRRITVPGRRRDQGPRLEHPGHAARRAGVLAGHQGALGHPPPGARASTSSSPRPRSSRPASRSSTCSPRTSRAARSACSAVPVSARPSSSRR